jgi:8-oxo-dGTP pyrophosphatase MutT (NUDIX family)
LPRADVTVVHPCLDEHGNVKLIARPSSASEPAAWHDPCAIATVVPGGPMPADLNGIPIRPWAGAPLTANQWQAYAAGHGVSEPPYDLPAGLRAAAGVVVVEDDGRIWLVAPTNGFGGYDATFPKGRLDPGTSLQCTALREAFEESGLQVEINAFLLDCTRTLTYTRYYVARRIGGSPAAMGWESQAVHLVPSSRLREIATHPNDAVVAAALAGWLAAR